MPDVEQVVQSLSGIAEKFAAETRERQNRRSLDPADFHALKSAGFLLTGVPADAGGLWRGAAGSARDYSRLVRTLAHGDPSVALVAAMHPAVMTFFLSVENVDDAPAAWAAQRQQLIELAREDWWGTVTSEPGSGGDILKTRTRARPAADEGFLLSGDKHFGSGSGLSRYMITAAKVAGADAPELFYLSLRDVPWDGTAGCQLLAEWDGMGMTATQSHAFRFADYPATKTVSAEILARCAPSSSQVSNLLFTGVILGVADNALAFARGKLDGKIESMRAFEQVEWIRCQNELWLAEQAYEGALRAIESGVPDAVQAAIRCKVTCAELVESALSRLSKVVGGA
ncbi:MAG: hypothetical protein O3B72_12190, partial [Proteobacteria bacterium]|nr:hypothetical protein [Pseudomonadota bacterium]